jgi:hypothetical protein
MLIEPSLDDPCTTLCVIDRALSRALQMESCPKFHNEVGVSIVRIGCREHAGRRQLAPSATVPHTILF